ncbi:tyrosine-protein phosphatase non-receptor type 23-like [Myxocyprinus asiaticus]|uniref:tyrosine-protein phosphatase non-receptor type 23-like n=1 Tax=Myxocyprinus asiaticus TaxID=70543 RepID=UPI002222DC0B|nr:tyrosine-protein phosphatase non-receptor type 23-like [Myxocyprinus asiaticus]XP_051527116.1 tyrosine-protein phosphatase non-receptor type 23-like [Myxocyprinus asiaticus]
MEAVPRMPMIWLELKEAGEFQFSPPVRQYIQLNYGENPENYSEALKRLEQLRQTVVNIQRDFEGCSTLRKYFGQLHFLQSRVPMAAGQEAAVPTTWTDLFSGRNVTHDDINYEQACVLYNLGALHSVLGAVDNRLSEEGMKVSCTHFQCSAGAFAYLRDHYNHSYSSDMSSQALSINISLMLAQAQECLLEKTLLDNRKSHLVARICAQVCNYYKDCLRVLDNSECVPGRIQKEWRKLICLKISYFSGITHLHVGKQSEEQQKFGEAVAYFQSSLDKLNEAIKQSKGQSESVQEALRFTMDVIGGKFNSAKKDNDFIYHESVPGIDTLAAVKGASLVKPLPVTPTDQSVTGPDLFSKLVPMATHEASSLYSEEKAQLLRDIVAKIEDKNQILERFMESLSSDSVFKVDMFKSLPDTLLEKCAFLSVRPDTVRNLVQAMQALSNVYTDVGSSLEEIHSALEEDEAGEKSLMEVVGQKGLPARPPALQEIQKDMKKYEAAHQAASHTNTELHRAMNQHIPNLRLLQGSVEELRNSLPQPQLSQDDMASLQKMKTILDKVDEMRKQRILLESQLRDLIHKDDITGVLVTADRAEIKTLFAEQLKKYDQLKGYIEQNLVAQDNILKALTEANVKYAPVRKTLTLTEQQWNSTVHSLISSFDAYEELMKKAEEGRNFYQDLDKKTSCLLDKTKSYCQTREGERVSLLEREIGKTPPPRSTGQKPVVGQKVLGSRSGPSSLEAVGPSLAPFGAGEDLPQELRSLPPNMNFARGTVLPNPGTPPTRPQGTSPFPPSQFPNPQFPNTDLKLRQQLAHHLPPNLAPYGQSSGPPQPSAPLQIPGLPQQFHARSAGGITPVYPQVNQSTASQLPTQGYNPALWQQAHSGPIVVSGGYTVPPQMGQMPQNSIRSGLPGPQVSLGQQMQTGIPQSSSAQPVMQGTLYQSFSPQPGQIIPSTTPRNAYTGQILPPFQPGQYQPPRPVQAQQQSDFPTSYRPVLVPHTQPQHGLPGQITVSRPQGAQTQPQSGPSNQFHPGQLTQNRTQPYMGYAPTSFSSSQTHQLSAPIQNPQQVQPGSQIFPHVPFSQNSQITFGPRPSTQPPMPPGAVPPQGNMYSFAPPHMGQQTIPPQFNSMFNGTGGQPMYTPSQSQIFGTQNVARPLSGQAVVPVMDNPVPPSLASTLVPTPSPAHISPQSQISTTKPDIPSSSLENQNLEPQTTPSAALPLEVVSDSTSILDSLQNKVDHLSIESQSKASGCGVDKGKNVKSELSNSCADAIKGSQDTMQSTIRNDDTVPGVPKKDQFGDLDPLWSLNKI